MKRLSVPFLSTLLTLGCSAHAENLQPALLDAPQADTIRSAIAQLLGHENTRISDNVFTESSALVLEPPQVKDASGNPIMGKVLEMPVRFQLLSDGENCYLKQLDSDKQLPLPGVSCHIK